MNHAEIKSLLDKISPWPWVARVDGWTIRSYKNNEPVHEGVKVAHTCSQLAQGQGHNASVQQQVTNQQFIAQSPKIISQLLAENQKQRRLLEMWDNYFSEIPLPTVNSYTLTPERIVYLIAMSAWRGDMPDELLQQLKGLNDEDNYEYQAHINGAVRGE